MSLLNGETVKIIAQVATGDKLSDEVCNAFAPDVEYRIREIIQVSFF